MENKNLKEDLLLLYISMRDLFESKHNDSPKEQIEAIFSIRNMLYTFTQICGENINNYIKEENVEFLEIKKYYDQMYENYSLAYNFNIEKTNNIE